MSEQRYDPIPALSLLVRFGVRFVVVGGFGGRLHGSNLVTNDLDICYARDEANIERLVAALRDLGAELRGAPRGLPFILDAKTIKMGGNFTFDTPLGPLDCLGDPAGIDSYDALERNALTVDLDGVELLVASLDDLIRMKRAAGRPKDRIAVEILGALREEIDAIEARKRKRRRRKTPRKR